VLPDVSDEGIEDALEEAYDIIDTGVVGRELTSEVVEVGEAGR